MSEACSPAGILGCSWTIPFYLLCAVLSCFSLVPLFVTPWTTACQAPLSWDTPDRNTAVGCHALQGIFPTQGSNPGLPRCRWILLWSEPPGKPINTRMGNLSLLQGIFLTHELNQGLLHCRWILFQLSYQESLANG